MSNEQTLKMTELDYLTAAPHLQMIKAALPYINIQEQRIFSLLVKIGELERTVQLFGKKEEGELGICSLEEDAPASPLDMLNAMKPYGTEAEQDFIDLIINFLQGSQLYQSYMDSMDVPDQEIPRQEPRQEQVHNQERSQNAVSYTHLHLESDFGEILPDIFRLFHLCKDLKIIGLHTEHIINSQIILL